MSNPSTPTTAALFDVIEVSLADPDQVRVIAEGKTERDAEAIVGMAVMRRGVETSYFTTRRSILTPEADKEESGE